jgi:hypothetical protein
MKQLFSLGVIFCALGFALLVGNSFLPQLVFREAVQVPYTERIPYQTTENMENVVGTVASKNLDRGTFTYWSLNIASGKKVVISWNADGSLYIFVLTENQFQQFKLWGTTTWYTAFDYGNSGTLTKTVENTDVYYLAISNPWIFTTIKVYSAQAKLTWQETVTRYREETRYRTEYIANKVNLSLYLGFVITGVGLTVLVAESAAKYRKTPRDMRDSLGPPSS